MRGFNCVNFAAVYSRRLFWGSPRRETSRISSGEFHSLRPGVRRSAGAPLSYRGSIPNTYTWFVVTTTKSPPTISR